MSKTFEHHQELRREVNDIKGRVWRALGELTYQPRYTAIIIALNQICVDMGWQMHLNELEGEE